MGENESIFRQMLSYRSSKGAELQGSSANLRVYCAVFFVEAGFGLDAQQPSTKLPNKQAGKLASWFVYMVMGITVRAFVR